MRYLVLLALAFTTTTVNAQTRVSGTVEKQQVLRYAEKMPEADYDVDAYIKKNIKYPEAAKAANEQGRFIVDFVVTKTGGFTNISVRNSGRYPYVSKEIVRVIQSMPKWRPATQAGKPVNVAYFLPVVVRAPK